ncbi:hypothetical protein XI06_17505 [Bradyrhizobium sp. CCBAU 11434]|nr:hypothetical protein [Bradyrhizobium sp. CCBAU 11434]
MLPLSFNPRNTQHAKQAPAQPNEITQSVALKDVNEGIARLPDQLRRCRRGECVAGGGVLDPLSFT